MADWIMNRVNFNFYKEEDYKEFKEFVKSDTLDFDFYEIVKPPQGEYTPEELNSWYSDNWGCKPRLDGGYSSIQDNFKFRDSNLTQYGYSCDVTFRTPYSPPIGIFMKLFKTFFNKDKNQMRWHFFSESNHYCYGYLEQEMDLERFMEEENKNGI